MEYCVGLSCLLLFLLIFVISTDICLEQQIKTHQCSFSVHPGGVLRSLECRLLFPPKTVMSIASVSK